MQERCATTGPLRRFHGADWGHRGKQGKRERGQEARLLDPMAGYPCACRVTTKPVHRTPASTARAPPSGGPTGGGGGLTVNAGQDSSPNSALCEAVPRR